MQVRSLIHTIKKHVTYIPTLKTIKEQTSTAENALANMNSYLKSINMNALSDYSNEQIAQMVKDVIGMEKNCETILSKARHCFLWEETIGITCKLIAFSQKVSAYLETHKKMHSEPK